ncbi:MAG: hypothetical protein RI957_494 [Verrucomicrobiota bacterium]|jgi:hypothetical protein
MKKNILHILAGISLVVASQSCAPTIDSRYALTADEMKTMKQAQFAHTADGTMKGAAVGAAAGALTAALTGGSSNDIQKAALSGGIAGAAAGGIMGYQQGDQAGKNKVLQKRSRQAVEKEISSKTENLRRLTSVAEKQIKLLRVAQEEGQTPEAIKSQARKIYNDYSKMISSNSYVDEYKGVPGDRVLANQVKKAKDLESALSKIMLDGNVQKI